MMLEVNGVAWAITRTCGLMGIPSTEGLEMNLEIHLVWAKRPLDLTSLLACIWTHLALAVGLQPVRVLQ